MVDDMETDWKVFAISTASTCTKADIEERIAETYDFLLKYKSYYKTEDGQLKPDGDNLNTFYDKQADDGSLVSPASLWEHKDSIWYNAEETMELIRHTHKKWENLHKNAELTWPLPAYCSDWDDYVLDKAQNPITELVAQETCPHMDLGPVTDSE